MILKMLQLKPPPPPINSDSSDEELETSLISSEEHVVGEIHMSENSSSVGKKEHIVENIATEEEDPAKNSPGGFHTVLAGDTSDGRSCRLHNAHISVFSVLFCVVTFCIFFSPQVQSEEEAWLLRHLNCS